MLCMISCHRQMRIDEALALADSLYASKDSNDDKPVMQSLLYYQRAIDALTENDTASLSRKANLYTEMGSLFAKLLLYDEAITRYQFAYVCATCLQDTAGMIAAYQSMGEMYRKKHDLGEAVHYYDLAEQLAEKARYEKPRISLALRMATAFMESGRLNLVTELLPSPPYQVSPEDQDIFNYVMWHIYSYTDRENKDSADYYLRKMSESPDIYYRTYAVDRELNSAINRGESQKAYWLDLQKTRLESEVKEQSRKEAMESVNSMYQALKVERQNAELQARNQQNKYYAIIVTLLLVLVVAISVIIIYRIINRRIIVEHTNTMTIRDADIYQRLLATEKVMSEAEQEEVVALLNQVYPTFISSLQQMGVEKEQDMKVCLLLKMGFKPSRIANLVSRTDSAIANTRARLYKKVLGKDGKAEDWDKVIMSL